jgi:hypothetical protein
MAVIATEEAIWWRVSTKQTAITGLYQGGARFESQPELPLFRLKIFVILERSFSYTLE